MGLDGREGPAQSTVRESGNGAFALALNGL
jgi:hypothetical protein